MCERGHYAKQYSTVQIQISEITTRLALHMHRLVGRPDAVIMDSLIMSFHANMIGEKRLDYDSDDPPGRFTLFTLEINYLYGSMSWHPS